MKRIFTDLDFSEWKIKALTETFLQEDDISYCSNRQDKRFGRILHEDCRGVRFYLDFDKKYFNISDAYLTKRFAGQSKYFKALFSMAITKKMNNNAYFNLF